MKRADDFEERRKHIADLSDEELYNRFWELTAQVVDLTGKVLRQNAIEGVDGSNQIQLNLNGISKGLYLLEINTPEGKSVRKVTVQ